MLIEILGKFYDNHSLSIVNRNIALALSSIAPVQIIAVDRPNPVYKLDSNTIDTLIALETQNGIPDIQLRHYYPPMLTWPEYKQTKVVYIQPWEFVKVPTEWQYKFETFADALIVPSNFNREVFVNSGMNPEKLFVVPNGYDHKVFNNENTTVTLPEVTESKFTFTFVGNTQWRKGLDILLAAWPKVFARADRVRLIIKDNPGIYGKTNILSNILKMQYVEQCAEIIYIDRDLSDKEMAALYKSTDILVHPYRAEGFGMHVQEAMACGAVPMVSANGPTDDFVSDSQGIKIPVEQRLVNLTDESIFAVKPGESLSLMGSYAYIFEPKILDLASLMYNTYHSHDRKEYLAQFKTDYVPNTWDHVARQYLKVLETVNDIPFVQRYKT